MKKIVLVALVFSALSATAQTFKNKVNLTVGKTYSMVVSGSGNNSTQMMGQSMESPIEMGTISKVAIVAAKGDSFEVSNTLSKLKFSVSAMGQDMKYDSDGTDNSEMLSGMGNAVGKTKTAMVSSNGGSASVASKVEDGANAGMMAAMTSSAGLGGFGAFLPVPANFEIKVGESKTIKNEQDKDAKTEATYKLISLTATEATFDVVDKAEMKMSTEAQGMTMELNSKVKTSSTLVVDVATGLITKRNVTIETDTTIDMQGMSMPQTGKMTLNVALTEQK